MNFRLAQLFLGMIACTLTVGCSSSSTVSGTVNLDGKPLPTGEVMFHPVGDGAMAVGTVTNGRFQMSTGQSDEVAPGSYKVTVIAVETLTPEQLEQATGPNGMEATGKRITPNLYADANTSPLTAEVKAGSNSFPFELTSQ